MSKIKLCYLYHAGDGELGLSKLNICLDNQYKFEWDEQEQCLSIRKKSGFINFYGDNISGLNLILGENGAGKTTTLNSIVAQANDYLAQGQLKVVKAGDKYHFFYPAKYHKDIEKMLKGDIKEIKIDFECYPYTLDENGLVEASVQDRHRKIYEDAGYGIIYFSNQFSLSNNVGDNGMTADVGLYHLLYGADTMFQHERSHAKRNTVTPNPRNFYTYIYQPYTHIFFMKDNEGRGVDKFNQLGFILPTCIKLRQDINSDFETRCMQIRERLKEGIQDRNKPLSDNEMEHLLGRVQRNKEQVELSVADIFYVEIVESILEKFRIGRSLLHIGNPSKTVANENLFIEIANWYKQQVFYGYQISDYIQQLMKLKNNLKEWLPQDILDKEHFEIEYLVEIEKGIRLLEFIDDNQEMLLIRQNKKYLLQSTQLLLNFKAKKIKDFLQLLIDVFPDNQVNGNEKATQRFTFIFLDKQYKDITYSTGEIQFLDMFSRIWNALSKLKLYEEGQSYYKVENILIALDEPDTYLHPEWQRKFLKMLTEYCMEYLKDINVQIVMTTNGAILTGDVLQEDIIIISKEKGWILKEKTFGRNIYNILKEFFTHKTIGDFAYGKIQELINLIQEPFLSTQEKEYVEKLIDQIGEPLIQRKLISMYSSKNDETHKIQSLELRVKELEDKLKQLEEENDKTSH
nr:AAA family ATPase [uncultured Niameybacter sp.]